MRQGREEAELLSQLLRIRTGHATQGDWQQLLGRLESRQTEAFMREFYSRSDRGSLSIYKESSPPLPHLRID